MARLRVNRKVMIAGGLAVVAMVAVVGCSSGNGNADTGGGGATVAPAAFAPGALVAPAPSGVSAGLGEAASRLTTFAANNGSSQLGIWVGGTGTVAVDPDIAILSVGVEAREATVSEARQRAAEAITDVIDALKQQGVADDDIVTRSFNIQPQTVWIEKSDTAGRYSEPQIVGYVVTNQLSVTLRDLEKVGEAVDAAAEAAGNEARINSISFGVDKPERYAGTARELAATDAWEKAQLYARTLGVQLGPIVFLSEGSSPVPSAVPAPAMARAEAGMAFAPTPISAGDVNISVSVQAAFAIVIPG
jgi:hypothetical protein